MSRIDGPESDGAGSDEQALIGKGKRPLQHPCWGWSRYAFCSGDSPTSNLVDSIIKRVDFSAKHRREDASRQCRKGPSIGGKLPHRVWKPASIVAACADSLSAICTVVPRRAAERAIEMCPGSVCGTPVCDSKVQWRGHCSSLRVRATERSHRANSRIGTIAGISVSAR
jgi:hypothetical protein